MPGQIALTVTPSRASSFASAFVNADDREFRCAVVREIRKAFLAGDRRDVDDPAAALRLQVRERRAAAEEGALRVHVHHDIPVALGQFGDRMNADHARAIHEDVEPAEFGERLRDHRVDLRGLRDVDLRDRRPPAERAYLARGGVERVVEQVGQQDVGARAGKRQRNAAADAARAARDDGDLSFE